MTKAKILRAATLVGILAAACSRKESAPEDAPKTVGAPATSESAAETSKTPPGEPDTGCPVGKWVYDYTDRFLDSMTNAAQGTKVVKESGTIVCTVSGRERGTYACRTSPGGVEHVLEANMADKAMRLHVKIEGESKVDYEPAGPNRWRTVRSDFGGLKVHATATVEKREVPLPDFALFRGWDEAGTILEYQCNDGILRLKPEGMKLDAAWVHLKPLE